MLIPLIFKNNDTESLSTKIGKVPPNMARALYSFGLVKKTGILKDYASECSITAPIDYNSNVGYARVTFNKGLISVCGGIIYIEQGTTFDIPVTSDMQNASLGVRIDLSRDAGNEVNFFYKTGSLIQNDLQANEVDGMYEFEIYKFNVSGGLLTLTYKTTETCASVESVLAGVANGDYPVLANALAYTSTAPTEASEKGIKVFVGSTLPSTLYDNVLYIII